MTSVQIFQAEGEQGVLTAGDVRHGNLPADFCLLVGQDMMCEREMTIDYHRKEMFFKLGSRTYRAEIVFSRPHRW